jgi:NAD-dependent DNA ligase
VLSPADLYRLAPDTLAGLERMGEKSAANCGGDRPVAFRPAGPLLFGLGIRHVGEEVARQLAADYVTRSADGRTAGRAAAQGGYPEESTRRRPARPLPIAPGGAAEIDSVQRFAEPTIGR